MRRYLTTFTIILVSLSLTAQKEDKFFDINNILEVRITFEQDNWEELLDSLKQEGKKDRLTGDVIINGVEYKKAGIRYKGNSSYFNVRNSGSSKLPFNIKVDHTDDDLELPGGYNTLKLSNLFRDPSFIREVLAYEIARKYMPASQANFAKLYINDTYLGIYNNTEDVDDEFLKHHFSNNDGILFKCDPNWHAPEVPGCPDASKASLAYLGENPECYKGSYELKTDKGWKDIIELARILNKEPEKLEEILNIDQTLWMLAFNNVLVNLDSYTGRLCHNYYIYKDTTGIFHPVVWDMNLCFGGFRYTGLGNPLSNEEMQDMSLFIHYREKNPDRPLITNLIGESLYRKVYIAHVKTMLDENFADSAFVNRALEIHDLITEEVKRDTNKLYPFEAFEKNLFETAKAGSTNIIGLTELMQKRYEILAQHPLIDRPFPVITEVDHKDKNEELLITANLKAETIEHGWLMFRNGSEGGFTRIEMFDDGKHDDKEAEDGIYGITVENKKGKVQYYIIAEGDKVASLSPERASMEFYEAITDKP